MLDIFFSVDKNEYLGLFTCINSIFMNTNNPYKLFIHILIDDFDIEGLMEEKQNIKNYKDRIGIYRLSDYPKYRKELIDLMPRHDSTYINNISNYARFIIPFINKSINRGLYMDADMIVKTDILNILKEIPKSFNICAAQNYTLEQMDLGKKYKGPAFNAGLYYLNFDWYRKNNIYEEIKKLMNHNKESPKWRLGTQPLINMVCYNQVYPIDARWNICGLGGIKKCDHPSKEEIKSAYVLHYTGECKPWMDKGYFKSIWNQYL